MTSTQKPKIWDRITKRSAKKLVPARRERNRVTYLVGVATRALPALNILEAAIRLSLSCLTLRLDIRTLIVTFNRDMVVAGDVQLLSGQIVVALPDLQAGTVEASVRAKVDAVVGRGQAVGGYLDFGASLSVDELLKSEERRRGVEAVIAKWKISG